ncbi:MAG: spore germination protein, partial [Oscillospiraceae bacterium]|nr:spore germination protein [Oscillospiraceae bacterium]
AGICSFTLPSQDLGGALRLMRLGIVGLSIALGLYGLMLGVVLLMWHLCSLESFGIAYTHPLSEGKTRESLATILRPPLWLSKKRDEALGGKDRWNQR